MSPARLSREELPMPRRTISLLLAATMEFVAFPKLAATFVWVYVAIGILQRKHGVSREN